MKLTTFLLAAVASVFLPFGFSRQVEPESRKEDLTYRVPVSGQPNYLEDSNFFRPRSEYGSSKGMQYYLANYGPLAKIIISDFMDSFGLARNLQLALPVIAKALVILALAVMQFQPPFLEFQQFAKSAYIFLQNFNAPELQVMNEITDKVFEAMNGGNEFL